jgi:hypothetical protein
VRAPWFVVGSVSNALVLASKVLLGDTADAGAPDAR